MNETVKGPVAAAPLPKGGTAPFSAFERMVAWRYLRSRRKEAVISVIALISFVGILLGVATLIIVMAVMNGFREQLLTRILGVNGHMIVQPVDRPLDDYDVVAKRIAAVPGVKYAIPLVEGQVLASGKLGAGTGALVRGIRKQDLEKIDLVAKNIRQGSLTDFGGGDAVSIGSRMAENLGIAVGDTITLISPDGDDTPFGVTPRMKAYKVTSIFNVGMSEYDSTIIFMPLDEAQLFFNSEGVAQSIEIYLDNPDAIDQMRPKIEKAAKRQIYLVDWRTRNETFFSALEVERNVMFMILTLIVLVAALNIISGLIMLVKDKSSDIAILRTMGATRGAVMRIFLMTGATIGIAGTAAGVVVGVIVTLNIERIREFFSWASGTDIFNPELYFLSRLPAHMDLGETVAVVLMAIGLSFLATIFPAWRAARLDPVQALRYE